MRKPTGMTQAHYARACVGQWESRVEETEANVYGWSSARAYPKAAEAPGAVRSAPAPVRTFTRSHGPSCVLAGIDMLQPSRPRKIER